MKFIPTTAVLLAGLLAAAGAHATSFAFSYSFDPANTGDGSAVTITGTFEGNLAGGLISDITDASLWINGTAFTGPLTIAGVDAATGDLAGAAVIATDVAQSNFAFTDSGFNNFFTIAGGQAFGVDYNLPDALGNATGGVETAANAHWTVTAAAVPEPATYALTAAGLFAVVGLAARRRRTQA